MHLCPPVRITPLSLTHNRSRASTAPATVSASAAAQSGLVRHYLVKGPLMFPSSNTALDTIELAGRNLAVQPRAVLLECGGVVALDASGLEALKETHKILSKAGRTLVISGLQGQPLAAAASSGLLDVIGKDNVVSDLLTAISRLEGVVMGSHQGGGSGGGEGGSGQSALVPAAGLAASTGGDGRAAEQPVSR